MNQVHFGRAVYEVARKEALQHLRTKRLLIFGGILLASLIFLTLVVPAAFFDMGDLREAAQEQGEDAYLHNGLFALFLVLPLIGGITLLTVLSITLTADGVCSEWQRKTLFLVLVRPVSRSAFVLGKFIGSVVPLVLMFSAVALIDYVLLMLITQGAPGGEEFLRFLGGLGLLSLGVTAYGALGLLFSALTRSSVPSFILSFLMAILIFPMLTVAGSVLYAIDANNAGPGEFPDQNDLKYDVYNYLNPGTVMSRAVAVMLPDDAAGGPAMFFGGGGDQRIYPAVVSSVLYTGLFVGLTLLAVRRRDFD